MKNTIWIYSVATSFALVAPSFGQQRFDSADAAAQAIIDAAGRNDTAQLHVILGPKGTSVVSCGDAQQDKAEQTEFAKLAGEKHELMPDQRNPNRVILSIGPEDWPFPVPIVLANGKWSFDASETKVEMAARHIGAHELDVIEIFTGYVEAQKKYASEYHGKDGMLKYASHMSAANGTECLRQLVTEGLAEATWDGPKKPAKPYHGYYFRILDGQGPHAPGGARSYLVKGKLMGGFGLVAWPAQYGVTGIKTFIVNQDGMIFEKDIEPVAGGAAPAITKYDPDPSWSAVD